MEIRLKVKKIIAYHESEGKIHPSPNDRKRLALILESGELLIVNKEDVVGC